MKLNKDLGIGNKFGRLIVKELLGRKKISGATQIIYKCLCDCGKETIAVRNSLITGNKKSCGCLVFKGNPKHGETSGFKKSRLYSMWTNMKRRCYGANYTNYKNWGGRGIVVCDEWKNDFSNFKRWALANGYKNNLTIDRINNDGNYHPSNCRFVDRKTNLRNTRHNINLTAFGETKCITAWSEDDRCHISYEAINARRRKGLSLYDSVFMQRMQ